MPTAPTAFWDGAKLRRLRQAPSGEVAGRRVAAERLLGTVSSSLLLDQVSPDHQPEDTLARLGGLLRRVVDQLGDAAADPVDGEGMLSPRWQAWIAAVRELRTVVRMLLDAGVEERRVALMEEQGAQIAAVIRAILDDLDLTPEQQARVPVVVPRRLREAGERIRQLEQEHSKM